MKSSNTRSPLRVTFLCIIIAVVKALSVNATIYDIPCAGGDFKAKLATVQPGDVIQLAAPCTYDLSYIDEYGYQRVYDLASDIPNANFLDEDAGFIIRGGSANPADTIVNARITDCEANILFENLSLSPQTGAAVSIDSEETTVFRNCIIELNSGYYVAVNQLYHAISIIDSTIVNRDQSTDNTEGISTENYFTLLRSTVKGFHTGLSWRNGNDPMSDIDIIFGNDLTANTIDCCVEIYPTSTCDVCSSLGNNPNTGAGKKVSVWGLRNLMSEDTKKLQLRIWIPEVAETGQTVGYKMPAAFPVKPEETLKIGTTPQYYQFHSTARLKKQGAGKARISFKSYVMKNNFDDATKIVAYFHTGVKWKKLSIRTKVKKGKEFYTVKIPKRFYLNGVVAFFETA